MSLKETIVQWSEGVEKFHDGNYKEALGIWSAMVEPASRILYNIASMHLLLGDLDNAKMSLDLAVAKDPHLALAYFQRGCVALQQKRYADCLNDMVLAADKLRNNPYINYKQLGLQFKLYSYEVLYNHACVHFCLGQRDEAIEKLETARSLAGFESQQKIITAALESIKLDNSFQSFQLPDNAMVFQPPRNKTEVLKPVNFLGKAKVVSSVKDQDSYVGFVGVQDEKTRLSKTSSPNPSILKKTVQPSSSASPHVPKPEGSASGAPMRIRSRSITLSLKNKPSGKDKNKSKKVQGSSGRPPKPIEAPPILPSRHRSNKEPMDEDESEIKVSKMTVKVHYASTRAMRVSTSISFKQLQSLICKKFDRDVDSLTFWCKKKTGDLKEINDEEALKEACQSLDDGFRLTMWAYDKHETEDEEDEENVYVLMVCQATHDYKGKFEDEISFNAGDEVDVTADINDDWYEGRCNGAMGIFPKSYVKAAKL